MSQGSRHFTLTLSGTEYPLTTPNLLYYTLFPESGHRPRTLHESYTRRQTITIILFPIETFRLPTSGERDVASQVNHGGIKGRRIRRRTWGREDTIEQIEPRLLFFLKHPHSFEWRNWTSVSSESSGVRNGNRVTIYRKKVKERWTGRQVFTKGRRVTVYGTELKTKQSSLSEIF